LLLDLRTFRSPLKENKAGSYIPELHSIATMLGEEQWNWLKIELMKPAKRASLEASSRFDTEADGDECWEIFLMSKIKCLNLFVETRASGVIFISGDVHFGNCAKGQNRDYILFTIARKSACTKCQ